jgi:hypothetical protein
VEASQSVPVSNTEAIEGEHIEPFKTAEPPRMLTMQEAAAFLGKSVRAIERSLLGRWGNKLPDGWSARKIRTERGEEWRIIPPPGFRPGSGVKFASESFEASASLNQTDWLQDLSAVKKAIYRSEQHSSEQPTIVIDRSEEVERLLRELLSTQKALSEERRLHMEDLRIVAQLQGSMRLLESSAHENSRAKSELESTRKELESLKEEYNQFLRQPWWKRLFGIGR